MVKLAALMFKQFQRMLVVRIEPFHIVDQLLGFFDYRNCVDIHTDKICKRSRLMIFYGAALKLFGKFKIGKS